ncbi:Serine protease family S33 [Phytophthora palmivora]|uniref:Serine protease family S33 n=1 Tax=Phytophthora palmivora TaxID=4796 RepID=A0A2P4YE46_9STRA|nr:Serine protease family S33 [Phytophthora palmivora]
MGLLRVLGAFGSHHSKDLMRYGKGFEVRTAAVDQFQWSYMIRPAANPKSREIVVLLHGLGSSKEAWLRVTSSVTKDYHIVIPDLPGHGKTTPYDPHMNFAADRQARRLHEFFESELYPNNKVHLVGTCMGATIAGVYAAMHPTRVKSLTLICPWGISMPTVSVTLSDFDDLGKLTLQSPTETSTSEVGEWRDRVASVANFAHTPRVFRALAISKRGQTREVLQKVLLDMLAHPTILEDELHSIRARTMVVWGDQDEVLDASCLKVIDDKLNVTRKHVLVLEKCGHLVPSDKPTECADVLNKFLADEELSFTFALAGQQAVMSF